MDNTGDSKQDGLRHLAKARVMGKLFGREKKVSSDNDVSDFLHGASDKLYMTGAPPPMLSKIDTSKASRWPTAAEVNHTRNTSRGRSASPRRSRKGLIVRFTDTQPEIIGEGGDEAEAPVSAISQFRRRSHTHPPMAQHAIPERAATTNHGGEGRHGNINTSPQDFRPPAVRRTQTGVPEIQLPSGPTKNFDGEGGNSSRPTKFLRSEPSDPNSYAARVQAEMRAAEGKALLLGSPITTVDSVPQAPQKTLNAPLTIRTGPPSPSHAPSLLTPGISRPHSREGGNTPKGGVSPIPKSPSYSPQATVTASGAEAMEDFTSRVKHFFKLFELSAESVKPLGAVTIDEFVRAASWWFLKGRGNLEAAARNKTSGPESHRHNDVVLQQGHTHLAKALWIVSEVIIQRPELELHGIDSLYNRIEAARNVGDGSIADVLERCQSILSNLQKLSISMKRNELLPPPIDEAILPQGLDTTIWIKYPSFTPDIPFLLSGKPGGSLGSQTSYPAPKLSDVLPLGDTQQSFLYTRMYVDLYLMEERIESQQFRCPCVLSISRAQIEKDLTIMIASQISLVTMSIQSDKKIGPTWSDLKWRTSSSNIEINLSRGFVAVLQLSPADFRTVWNMYDYTMKIHGSLQPRRDEELVFEKILESVQYFDRDPASRVFPKEPVANCEVRIMEKKLSEMEGTGVRHKHRGYRIAIITHSKTKQLSGISMELPTSKPLLYGFMRGETGAPALLLKFEDMVQKPATMVLNFDDIEDRALLHRRITGDIRDYEIEMANVPLLHFSISSASRAAESPKSPDSAVMPNALDEFDWEHVRVINKEVSNFSDPEQSVAVLSESLRIIVESRNGNITDRLNVAPGELKFRLTAQITNHEMIVLREPQEDMTIAVSEAQSSRETPGKLTELLNTFSRSRTSRRYRFSSIQDLHTFQAAVTGFRVLFDGLAESFAISHRRSMVPIHKKSEALNARIQILCHEKVLQLAVFFEGFAHGDCMNFTIKATDVFESLNRSSKFCVRIVDAKFATPKGADDSPDGKGYICLDMPDYPGEHDDITISFNTELGMAIRFFDFTPCWII